MFALPSKLTPLIVLAEASVVAVDALPVKAPMKEEAANALLAHGVRIWSWWTQESYSNAVMHVAEYTNLSIWNSEPFRFKSDMITPSLT